MKYMVNIPCPYMVTNSKGFKKALGDLLNCQSTMFQNLFPYTFHRWSIGTPIMVVEVSLIPPIHALCTLKPSTLRWYYKMNKENKPYLQEHKKKMKTKPEEYRGRGNLNLIMVLPCCVLHPWPVIVNHLFSFSLF